MRGQGGVGNAWQSKFEMQLFEKQILMGFDWDLNFWFSSKFCCGNREKWSLSKFLESSLAFWNSDLDFYSSIPILARSGGNEFCVHWIWKAVIYCCDYGSSIYISYHQEASINDLTSKENKTQYPFSPTLPINTIFGTFNEL